MSAPGKAAAAVRSETSLEPLDDPKELANYDSFETALDTKKYISLDKKKDLLLLFQSIPVHHFPILFPAQSGTSARLSDLVENLQHTGPSKNQRKKNWKQAIVAEWLATIYSLMIIRDVGDDDEEQYSTQVAASLTTLELITVDVRKVVVEYNAVPVATT